MDEAPKKTSGWKTVGYVFGGLLAFGFVADRIAYVSDPVAYEKAKAIRDAKEMQSSTDAADATPSGDSAEDRRKGFHCLSKWDGSNRSAVDQIKAGLRDPDSFEHIETRIYPLDKGEHGALVSYRARNGFGGLNVEKMYARINSASCEARLLPGGPGTG